MIVAPSANLRIQFTNQFILILRLPFQKYSLLDRGLDGLKGFVRRSDDKNHLPLITMFPEVPSEEIETIINVCDETLSLLLFQSLFL